MTASLAAAAVVTTSCPTPITMDDGLQNGKISTSSPSKRYKQKRPERKLKSVVEPGIEPYAPSVSFTHNHAEKELLDKIWDEELYAEKYPTIPLGEVREHYSPDVGDGSVWVTFKGGVYDVTSFMNHHPGLFIHRRPRMSGHCAQCSTHCLTVMSRSVYDRSNTLYVLVQSARIRGECPSELLSLSVVSICF